MTHDTLVLVVITFAPLIYMAVLCPSEGPMRRLIALTRAIAVVLSALRSSRRK